MVTPDRVLRLRGTGVGGVTIPGVGVGTGVAPPTPVVTKKKEGRRKKKVAKFRGYMVVDEEFYYFAPIRWEGKENKGVDFYCTDFKLEFVIFQDTEATSSSSRSVTPRDLESQKDENTTPINAAKTIATTCADKDPTKKRVAEDDIGSESSNAKKKAVALKIEKDT
ncbi:hypothetical protein Tco_0291300 [Tanacetum coccineum]